MCVVEMVYIYMCERVCGRGSDDRRGALYTYAPGRRPRPIVVAEEEGEARSPREEEAGAPMLLLLLPVATFFFFHRVSK